MPQPAALAIVVLTICITSLWHFELDLTSITDRARSQADNRSESKSKGPIKNQVTASGTPYTAFVHKLCAETFSFGYSWFTNTFNIVCDPNDVSPLCTIKMDNSNGYDSLGEKSLSLWKYVQNSDDVEDIIIKIDDDTMIQKHVFDEFVDEFAKRTDNSIAGVMNTWGGDFYWPLGRLYMFRKSFLPPADDFLWQNATFFNKWEDCQLGYLIQEKNVSRTFYLEAERFYHSTFQDARVNITFKRISAICNGTSSTITEL
ncbi:hypothetical protein BGZ70_007408 [Mortierella alpina]|uniref:Uncharacterized protein n=1 Tax=Mortierella alpina TaxID=64518 RepID=A0A9P6J6D5_MORAP|nr:hypothetical protein BGZ70_007408 [Mortierella alpina]